MPLFASLLKPTDYKRKSAYVLLYALLFIMSREKAEIFLPF